jgi:hypothetical protein
MTLLSSFTTVRYKGIDGLSLPRLSRANLITGVNGVGKTALIEAIWLFMGRYNPMLLWNANVQRARNPVRDPVNRLSGSVLELHGTEEGQDHSVRWTFEPVSESVQPLTVGEGADRMVQLPVVGRISTYLDDTLAKGNIGGMQPTSAGLVKHENPLPPAPRPTCVIEGTRYQLETSGEFLRRYSDLVRENRKRELKDAMSMILPAVSDFEILTDEKDESYLSGVTADGKQLPLHDLGGGVVRLCQLLLSCFASRGGILLVDEMENGIHHSALPEVWNRARQWMWEWSVQLVATTHSAECIEAATHAFADAPDELSVHKLFTNNQTGNVEAATFTGDTLEGARDLDLEIR